MGVPNLFNYILHLIRIEFEKVGNAFGIRARRFKTICLVDKCVKGVMGFAQVCGHCQWIVKIGKR